MSLSTRLALFFAVTLYSQVAATLQPAHAFPCSRAQLSSEQSTYTLRGKVVNSVTGEPVRGALVQAYFNVQRSALTGPDGTFQFEGLRVNLGSVAVRKPGYFSPDEIHTSRFSTSRYNAAVTLGPDQPPIVLKLVPEGLIYGHISGDGGEPIENMPVHLFSEAVENGQKAPREIRTVNTNEEGEFRAAELAAGKYFLFVGPSQEEGFDPRGRGQSAQGYAGTFYAASPDLASATPIEIAAGARVEINLALSPQSFFRVSGSFSGVSQNEGVGVQFMNATGQSVGSLSSFDPVKGTFQTTPMPPGAYTVTAQAQDPKTQRQFFASRSLNLNSDLSGVHLMLTPGAVIPVEVRLELIHSDSTASQPQFFFGGPRRMNNSVPARVALTSKDGLSQMQFASESIGNAENDPQAIRNVPPGTYTVAIYPTGPYYAESARSGSTDLLRESLLVSAGGSVQPIQIVLRDDFATLSGTVSEDGHAVSEMVQVLAIPENAPAQARPIATSHPQGLFNLGQLAPGPYKILAVDRQDGFEYANPEVLNKYLSKARDITLSPNQNAKVDLELVRLGDGPS
jgi:hypothetical protein